MYWTIGKAKYRYSLLVVAVLAVTAAFTSATAVAAPAVPGARHGHAHMKVTGSGKASVVRSVVLRKLPAVSPAKAVAAGLVTPDAAVSLNFQGIDSSTSSICG